MVLVEQLLQMIRKWCGNLGVEVRDVRDKIDQVVELLDVLTRSRGGRGDENLALGVVGEPLVVEFLRIRSVDCESF